jgi:hypothetical protein
MSLSSSFNIWFLKIGARGINNTGIDISFSSNVMNVRLIDWLSPNTKLIKIYTIGGIIHK